MAEPATSDPRATTPALRLLVVAKTFKTLKLAKAMKIAKLGKSVRPLRRRLALTGAPPKRRRRRSGRKHAGGGSALDSPYLIWS